MRTLLTLTLSLCMVVHAPAQSAEVIIRRPGQKDQVIKVDTAVAAQKLRELRVQGAELAKTMAQRNLELDHKLASQNDIFVRSMGARSAGIAGEIAALTSSLSNWAVRPILGITVDIRSRETDRY